MKLYNLIIKEEAREEIISAFFWYESKQPQLGERFLNKLDDCFDVLKSNPNIYSRKYKSMRQAIVSKFPFVVIYEIEKRNIIVYAVFNTSQDPEKWKKRIP